MHQSAMSYGEIFFQQYLNGAIDISNLKIVEIGSLNVNGALRDVAPTNANYIGLDFAEGNGVDIVIDDPYHLPLDDNSADIVVSSSCFEHSEFFWLVFLEVMRVLKKDGVFYLNAPSNGFFHQWPVDCWRFYPDAGHALVNWAKRNGYSAKLLESFIGKHSEGTIPQGGMWNDFVAVFVKDSEHATKYPFRIVDVLSELHNGYSDLNDNIINFNELSPDFDVINAYDQNIKELTQLQSTQEVEVSNLKKSLNDRNEWRSDIEKIVEKNFNILLKKINDREELIQSLTNEVSHNKNINKQLTHELELVLTSKSWKITRPLREARRLLFSPKQRIKLYVKKTLQQGKRLYLSLPLSADTRQKHRLFLAEFCPRILTATEAPTNAEGNFNLPPVPRPLTNLPNPEHVNSSSEISFSESESPAVSILIPVYGKLGYTLRCLASIQHHEPSVPFEVIVIDDCSPDETFTVLSEIKGLKVIRNFNNAGFIRSCNAGAQAARGKYLCFLNNDTEITPNWLEELLRTFSEFPDTGLVGSKLIYPDGRLQEAGGIIWQDGSAWNFGRFQDPNNPVFNYAREVDYCSGASIMVPKDIFNNFGGFDELYTPAYCEDSDLALKLRSRGYRVIYQPLSSVIHYEGITSGTDEKCGVKAYQVKNSAKLLERWKGLLASHQPAGTNVDKAKDRRMKKRVLVLDHCVPTPNQDAGSVTVYNLLLLLREMNFQVTFIAEDNLLYLPGYTADLQRIGIEVLYKPYTTSVQDHLREFGNRYDLIFFFRPMVAEKYMDLVKRYTPEAKILYHTVDLHYLRMEREAKLENNTHKAKSASAMRDRELTAIRKADASIVHSTIEFEILKPLVPESHLFVFPLIMNINGSTNEFEQRRDIAFIGGYQHTPNVDAVTFMANEIMPILRTKMPGVRFYVIGSRPPKELYDLASDDVIITGFVDELEPFLENIRVSVAPLRYGAGIKGKLGTAMALGLPVVATPIAAEGMNVIEGEHLLVGTDPESLALNIVELYENKALWSKIRKNGIDFAKKNWGAEASWNTLSTILSYLNFQIEKRQYPISLYNEKDSIQKQRHPNLKPLASVTSKEEFLRALNDNNISKIVSPEKTLLDTNENYEYYVTGYCSACLKKVDFLVDLKSGGQKVNNQKWKPNWRERLECPECHLNNRQRLITHLLRNALENSPQKTIYLMEQVTPIFKWVSKTFEQHKIIGSEYLGPQYKSGEVAQGIRNENVENLSFSDSSLDLIISNDVFEHVPNPRTALLECSRALKKGGVMLFTIPFHNDKEVSTTRAQLSGSEIKHLQPPTYHGNPVSNEGSLVFTDFGWDFLSLVEQSGFSRVSLDLYASNELCHIGEVQIVFQAIK